MQMGYHWGIRVLRVELKKEGTMIRKIIMLSLALALLTTPVFAGNCPEFDAVGWDPLHTLQFRDYSERKVVIYNKDRSEKKINFFSDFSEKDSSGNYIYDPPEFFTNTAGVLRQDPCFADFAFSDELRSATTDPWNEAMYEWQIVLQMKPESDIKLNIVDCVLKHNKSKIWTDAEQTGRFRRKDGQLAMVLTANPRVTVIALPGPYHTNGFPDEGFHLDARTLPGLDSVPLDDALYTSVGFWEGDIVMVLPETGGTNKLGESVYNLKQGDAIRVSIAIPSNNAVDVSYGPNHVALKYIGIVGTQYVTPEAGGTQYVTPDGCLCWPFEKGEEPDVAVCPEGLRFKSLADF